MMDWLMNLLGYGGQDSEGQLRAAQQRQHSYSDEAEHHARQAGFPSAAAMTDYLYQRNHPTGGTTQGNQSATNMKYLHPAESLGYTLNRYKEATDGQ